MRAFNDMRTSVFAIFVFATAFGTLRLEASTKGGDPAMQKMREMMRNSMIQLRDANAKLAVAQAAQAEAEDKVKELQGKLDDLVKKSTSDKKKDDQTIEDLQKKLAQAEQQSAHLSESLSNWKAGYSKLAGYAKGTEAKRSELASAVVVMNRQIADQKMKNSEMYRLACEILDRYAKFSLGTAIAAREPFVGITKVKLENLVQEYDHQLSAQTIGTNAAASASKYETPSNEKIEPPKDR
jgi:chromosome segregation ATPase